MHFTDKAIQKMNEVMNAQSPTEPRATGIRISVVGGGCAGFGYSMKFESQSNIFDKTYFLDGLTIYIDQASLLYLEQAEIDYIETLESSGFKFTNNGVKSTCGCGSSF